MAKSEAMPHIGEIIQELRKRTKISQIDLCGGICSVSALSRIETGKIRPSYPVYCALIWKLGYNPQMLHCATPDDVEFYNQFSELEFLIMGREYDQTEACLERLRIREGITFEPGVIADKTDGGHLRLQMLLTVKASVVLNREKDLPAAEEWIRTSIAQTIPNFNEADIGNQPYTYEEISALSLLAAVFNRAAEVRIYYGLIQSMERYQADEYGRSRGYTQTAMNLADALVEKGDYQQALNICALGIQCAEKHKQLQLLPHLKFIKAYALFRLGNEKDEYRSLVVAAYYAQINNGDLHDAATTKRYAESEMGIECLL